MADGKIGKASRVEHELIYSLKSIKSTVDMKPVPGYAI